MPRIGIVFKTFLKFIPMESKSAMAWCPCKARSSLGGFDHSYWYFVWKTLFDDRLKPHFVKKSADFLENHGYTLKTMDLHKNHEFPLNGHISASMEICGFR